jgi:hypothetical protein
MVAPQLESAARPKLKGHADLRPLETYGTHRGTIEKLKERKELAVLILVEVLTLP